MNFTKIGRICRIAAIGVTLLGSAACIDINEGIGQNFIPTDQQWDVFTPEPVYLQDIRLQMSDSLSGYSTQRITIGAVNDDILGSCIKSSSITLVPINDTLDFGDNPVVRQFHMAIARDTLSTIYDYQQRTLQNIYITELKKPIDSLVLYTGSFMNQSLKEAYVSSKMVSDGIPVYDGGDSLSFNFSKEYAQKVIKGIDQWQRTTPAEDRDSLDLYLKTIPGIYMTTDQPAGKGGRINMFELALSTNTSGYVSGNYAELKIRTDYGDRRNVDTTFLFILGPSEFVDLEGSSLPTQIAFNASNHTYIDGDSDFSKGVVAKDKIFIEGGAGIKPVIKATEIKDIVERIITDEGVQDISQVVINKATIVLPYDVETLSGGYEALDKFPRILSPTVRLRSTSGKQVTYAGLTDSSIESENQGDINRSLGLYSPDISHHVQEILKLDRNSSSFDKDIERYDIWMLIMYEEITQTSSNNSYNDYYNNLLYNSYYNSMMYDPYGYGYGGYGGYGYGYGGYGGYGSYGGYGGYGYNNYYNYYMMAALASSSSSSSNVSSSIELDRDRYYNGILAGPESASDKRPYIKITFSAPQTAE